MGAEQMPPQLRRNLQTHGTAVGHPRGGAKRFGGSKAAMARALSPGSGVVEFETKHTMVGCALE